MAFAQCPYCSLEVPRDHMMMHLSSHPGYVDAFLGRGSAAAVRPQGTVPVRAGTGGSAVVAEGVLVAGGGGAGAAQWYGGEPVGQVVVAVLLQELTVQVLLLLQVRVVVLHLVLLSWRVRH